MRCAKLLSWSAPSASLIARALLSKRKLRTKKARLGFVIPLILPIRPSPKQRANGATGCGATVQRLKAELEAFDGTSQSHSPSNRRALVRV